MTYLTDDVMAAKVRKKRENSNLSSISSASPWPPHQPPQRPQSSQFYAQHPLPILQPIHVHGSRKPSAQILPERRKVSSRKKSSLFHPNSTPSPTQPPVSLESSGAGTSAYKVVQRLLPDVSLARHIVDSDDHAFAFSECCNHHHSSDLNNNSSHQSVLPKMSAERRRDHLHMMRRRKSRARLLSVEELRKLAHFRKFMVRAGVGPHALIHRVLEIRRHERLHAYDENGVPAAKLDVIR